MYIKYKQLLHSTQLINTVIYVVLEKLYNIFIICYEILFFKK